MFDLEWHQAEGGSPGTILFLTMELLDGETLSSRVQRGGRMSAAEALPLIGQMADALDAAHRCGVIHRDFKASNVMLVSSGEGVRAVVTDFGLARAISTADETTATLSNNVAGTLDYMAPELLTGMIATFRSDIYALGVVAYKMVTGALPFAGETPLAGAFLRARTPVPSPRALAPGLDSTWEHAILRALDRDPGRRFSSTPEFARALRGEPVPAPPALPRLVRRKALAAGCALAAVTVAWLGWQSWAQSRFRPSGEAARLYQQGVDDIHAGAYFAATKALDQAVQLAPHFSPARARLAESWVELDLPERAAREFLPVRRENNSALPKLEQLQIEAVDLTITREFAAAASKYEQVVARAGTTSAELDVDLGRAYEKGGKPDKAIEAYRRAAEGPAHSPAAWLRLGVLYSQRKKLVESEAAFAQADRRYQLSSNLEGLTELSLQRGVAANRILKYPEAADYLRKAMEHAHETGNIHQEIRARLTLANMSYAAGDSGLAEILAREALVAAQANQMEPLTIRGFNNLGASHAGRNDFAGAEENFLQALTLALRTNSPRLAAQSRLYLASLHDSLHRSEDQIREASEALAYFQPNRWVQETFQALLLLGRGELYRENFAAAQDSFQRLLGEADKAQDRAQFALAQEGLGNVFSKMELYPQALEHYQQFLSSSSDNRSIGYAALDCAITLTRLGRYAEALPEFSRAEEMASKLPELRPSIARSRVEAALSRNEWREAISLSRVALDAANLRPLMVADLTRFLGLALLRSNDRKAGLQECEEALEAARKQNDPGTLLDTRLAVLEARLAVRDSAGAAGIFHEMEPALVPHPERRWRAFVLLARFDPQYADRAKEAIGQLDSQWGQAFVRQYLKRPDVLELSRHLFSTDSAKH